MSELKEFHNENKEEELKKLEMELRKTIDELKYNNAQLKVEKERAEKSDKLKSIFLANMSHEIRTPMNSIIGFTKLLLTNGFNKSQTKKYLKIINKNSEQLLTLLNDIIDLSKIEIGELKLDKSEFSLTTLMEEIYSSFYVNKHLQEKQIDFKYDFYEELDCNVISDRNRLKQILNNLISNAIKFTEKGSIHFGCYFIEPGILKCYVKDTGPGISDKHKYEIFNRFVQVDREEHSKKEGTGLGLSITKGLIKLLGGEIGIKSKKDKGTIFYFTIPVQKTEDNSEISDNVIDKKYDFSNVNILIAEDIEDNYQLIREILKKTKCNMKWVKDGLQCLNEFKKRKYDIILMDMRMPIMSGYDAVKRIRELDKDIPIIAQTAYALTNDKQNLLSIGCSEYIPKPIDNNELLSTISKYI